MTSVPHDWRKDVLECSPGLLDNVGLLAPFGKGAPNAAQVLLGL
jgi:hypothetical protein